MDDAALEVPSLAQEVPSLAQEVPTVDPVGRTKQLLRQNCVTVQTVVIATKIEIRWASGPHDDRSGNGDRIMGNTMNILELIRRKQVREERIEDAKRVSLCYRGNVYVRSVKN